MSAPSIEVRPSYVVSYQPKLFKADGSILEWAQETGVSQRAQDRFAESGTGVLDFCMDKILLWGGCMPDWTKFQIEGTSGKSAFIHSPDFEIPDLTPNGFSSRITMITDARTHPRFRRTPSIAFVELVEQGNHQAEASSSDENTTKTVDQDEIVLRGPVYRWIPGVISEHPRMTISRPPHGFFEVLDPEPSTDISNPHTNYLVRSVMSAYTKLCPPEAELFSPSAASPATDA